MIKGWRIEFPPEATTDDILREYNFIIANMKAEHKVTDSQIIKSGYHLRVNGQIIDRIELSVFLDPETGESEL